MANQEPMQTKLIDQLLDDLVTNSILCEELRVKYTKDSTSQTMTALTNALLKQGTLRNLIKDKCSSSPNPTPNTKFEEDELPDFEATYFEDGDLEEPIGMDEVLKIMKRFFVFEHQRQIMTESQLKQVFHKTLLLYGLPGEYLFCCSCSRYLQSC